MDFPPGTGDIQLTLCQTVAFSAAVIVTTPQKMAFIDVAKVRGEGVGVCVCGGGGRGRGRRRGKRGDVCVVGGGVLWVL